MHLLRPMIRTSRPSPRCRRTGSEPRFRSCCFPSEICGSGLGLTRKCMEPGSPDLVLAKPSARLDREEESLCVGLSHP